MPPSSVPAALRHANKFSTPSLSAAKEIVAMSDILFYGGRLLEAASHKTGRPKPVTISPWGGQGGSAARLVTVYGGRKRPVAFIININFSSLAPGYLDGMQSKNSVEALFWAIQHELLHIISRITEMDKKGGQRHCIPALTKVGKLKYGGKYNWGPCVVSPSRN